MKVWVGRIFLLILIMFLFYACSRKTSDEMVLNDPPDSLMDLDVNGPEKGNSIQLANSQIENGSVIRFDSTIVRSGNDTLIVINTNLGIKGGNAWRTFNPLVLRQELVFLNEGLEVNRAEYPVLKSEFTTESGDCILAAENVLTGVSVMETRKGAFYIVYGFGACDNCTESFGFYSLSGDLLYFSYASTDSVVKVFGDADNVCEKYEVAQCDKLFESRTEVRVYAGSFHN